MTRKMASARIVYCKANDSGKSVTAEGLSTIRCDTLDISRCDDGRVSRHTVIAAIGGATTEHVTRIIGLVMASRRAGRKTA